MALRRLIEEALAEVPQGSALVAGETFPSAGTAEERLAKLELAVVALADVTTQLAEAVALALDELRADQGRVRDALSVFLKNQMARARTGNGLDGTVGSAIRRRGSAAPQPSSGGPEGGSLPTGRRRARRA